MKIKHNIIIMSYDQQLWIDEQNILKQQVSFIDYKNISEIDLIGCIDISFHPSNHNIACVYLIIFDILYLPYISRFYPINAQNSYKFIQFWASVNVVRLRNKVYMINNMKIAVRLRTKSEYANYFDLINISIMFRINFH